MSLEWKNDGVMDDKSGDVCEEMNQEDEYCCMCAGVVLGTGDSAEEAV